MSTVPSVEANTRGNGNMPAAAVRNASGNGNMPAAAARNASGNGNMPATAEAPVEVPVEAPAEPAASSAAKKLAAEEAAAERAAARAAAEAAAAATAAEIGRIIARTEQRPTIVNEASNFVVVTYWWGSGRSNKNTARPCLDFYEYMLLEPFKRAEKLIIPRHRLEVFDLMKFFDKPPLTEFYEKKAQKYIREAEQRDVEDDDERIEEVVQLIIEPVRQCFQMHLDQVKTLIRIQDRQNELKLRLEKENKNTPAITAEVNALIQQYKDIKAAIKVGIRPFIARMEAPDYGLLYKPSITYNEMIDNWGDKCAENGANHLAVEYPEFTRPGGYQLAINAKPLFIQKALELCAPRAVVYIDGDMTINHYPRIFDVDDVDFMARGWHIDPRSSWKYLKGDILVDPYKFETSGGIMYFSQSQESKRLLQEWVTEAVRPYQVGKADDRIISMIFNSKRLLAPMKIIQLPVEYLWLSLDYDYSIEEADFDRERIFVEHPECLTSEDTAAGGGASSDRTPKYYSSVEYLYPRSEELHESVMFHGIPEVAEDFRPYLNYLNRATYTETVGEDHLIDAQPFYVFRYGDFGRKNDIYRHNLETIASTPDISTNANRRAGQIEFNEETFTLPNILKALSSDLKVVYMPSTAKRSYVEALRLLNGNDRLEFIFADQNKTLKEVFFFRYEINMNEPMYIKPTPHTLLMFSLLRDVSEIKTVLRESYEFLSRIRCHALKPARRMAGGGDADAEDADFTRNTDVATNFLYGAVGGRRRALKTRRKKHARRNTRRRKN